MHFRKTSERRPARALAVAAILLPAAAVAADPDQAAPGPAQQLPPVQVLGNYVNGVGTSDAASAGTVTSKLIENRPTLRPAEVLEFVPGVIVTQHSGDGKANQYFLRGFNLDHGTDFATFVDGMPVNMPTHAHGQGYTDLNFLIPELVDRASTTARARTTPRKATSRRRASARIDLLRRAAARHRARSRSARTATRARCSPALAALGDGSADSTALEGAHNDGPWENPEKFRKRQRRAALRRRRRARTAPRSPRWATTASWNSTDQIPQRAVDCRPDRPLRRARPERRRHAPQRYSLSLRTRATRSTTASSGSTRTRSARGSTCSRTSPTSSSIRSTSTRPRSTATSSSRPSGARSSAWRRVARWNAQARRVRRRSTRSACRLRHDRIDPVGLYATVARERAATTQESEVAPDQRRRCTPRTRRSGRRGCAASPACAPTASTSRSTSSIAGQHRQARRRASSRPKLSLVFGPWQQDRVLRQLRPRLPQQRRARHDRDACAGQDAAIRSIR